MSTSEKMNVAWLFLDKNLHPLEIWVKCKDCGKWNKVCEKREIGDFRPTATSPTKKVCANSQCRKQIKIERVWFARRGLKKPTEDC